MGEVSTIGVDIAKSVFQIHGVDADGTVVIRKRVSRAKVLEFFAKSAALPRWHGSVCNGAPVGARAQEARARHAAHAADLCQSLREARQERCGRCGSDLRGRDTAIDAFCADQERRAAERADAAPDTGSSDPPANATDQCLRAHLAELGLVAAKGHEGLQQLVMAVTESSDERLPGNARFACQAIIAQLHAVQTQINGLDKRVTQAHRANADSKRLETIPGFGVILSTAVVATMTDPKAFRTGREFAAWIGLVPRQNSTGGKERLGSISKQGDRYLRRLFVLGAISIVRIARARPEKYPWLIQLLARRPFKVVAVALANKMARVAWAVLARGETYRAPIRSSSAVIVAAA